MPTYIYPTTDALSIRGVQGRTTSTGAPAPDLSGEEDRLIHAILSEGALDQLQPGAFQTRPTGTGMGVRIGSGNAETDLLVVAGQVPGQGRYLVRHDAAYTTLTLDAPDAATERTDRIYAVVWDQPYDANPGGLRMPRFAYAKGDIGQGAPAPDPAWKASKSLGRWRIRPTGAGGGTLATNDVTDEQGDSKLLLTDFAELFVNGSVVWHAGNDGAGSGLDADMVDGFHVHDLLREIAWSLPLTGNSVTSTSQVRIQGGTRVAVTDGGGGMRIPFDLAFPNALGTFLAMSGDINVVVAGEVGLCSKNWGHVQTYWHDGDLLRNTLVRVNWLAVGW